MAAMPGGDLPDLCMDTAMDIGGVTGTAFTTDSGRAMPVDAWRHATPTEPLETGPAEVLVRAVVDVQISIHHLPGRELEPMVVPDETTFMQTGLATYTSEIGQVIGNRRGIVRIAAMQGGPPNLRTGLQTNTTIAKGRSSKDNTNNEAAVILITRITIITEQGLA